MSTYRERVLRCYSLTTATTERPVDIAAEADAAMAERDALIERLAGALIEIRDADGALTWTREVAREALATYHQQRTAQEGAGNE